MFKSKNNETSMPATKEMNHISPGTKVIGDIISVGTFRLEGELEGNLVSQAKVILSETSVLNGTLKAQNAELSGKVIGNVEVTEELVLKSTAQIDAEITTGKLVIESGAEFNGTTKMGGVVKGISGKNGSEKTEKSA